MNSFLLSRLFLLVKKESTKRSLYKYLKTKVKYDYDFYMKLFIYDRFSEDFILELLNDSESLIPDGIGFAQRVIYSCKRLCLENQNVSSKFVEDNIDLFKRTISFSLKIIKYSDDFILNYINDSYWLSDLHYEDLISSGFYGDNVLIEILKKSPKAIRFIKNPSQEVKDFYDLISI